MGGGKSANDTKTNGNYQDYSHQQILKVI